MVAAARARAQRVGLVPRARTSPGLAEVLNDAIADLSDIGRGEAEQLSTCVCNARPGWADAIDQAALMHASDAGGTAGERDACLCSVSAGAQERRRAQPLEHCTPLDAARLGTQGGALAWRIGGAVRIALLCDAPLLAASKVGSDFSGQSGTGAGRQAGEDPRSPGLQACQVIHRHFAFPARATAPLVARGRHRWAARGSAGWSAHRRRDGRRHAR